jgi:hypothetical protein
MIAVWANNVEAERKGQQRDQLKRHSPSPLSAHAMPIARMSLWFLDKGYCVRWMPPLPPALCAAIPSMKPLESQRAITLATEAERLKVRFVIVIPAR